VKLIGDEIMWTSGSLFDAVAIALELMRRVREAEGMPDLHVGIAEGSTVALGGDVFGPAVNLAARLTRVARPGSVVIPRPEPDVLAELGARGDVTMTKVRRTYDLKGIGDTKITVIRPLVQATVADPDGSGSAS
jgi:adenylate cyclase